MQNRIWVGVAVGVITEFTYLIGDVTGHIQIYVWGDVVYSNIHGEG